MFKLLLSYNSSDIACRDSFESKVTFSENFVEQNSCDDGFFLGAQSAPGPDRKIIGQPPVDVATNVASYHIVDMRTYISALLNESSNLPHRVPENVPDLGERYPIQAVSDRFRDLWRENSLLGKTVALA